jgi:hypothetical protein
MYRNFVRKPLRKLGRTRRRLEDNIKTDLREIGLKDGNLGGNGSECDHLELLVLAVGSR